MNKNLFYIYLLFFIILSSQSFAQDVNTIKANSDDLIDNIDLEAAASIFGESKDLENFEKRLNDPNTKISNLDLNNYGEVDYLRVMETAENNVQDRLQAENKHLVQVPSELDININSNHI